MNKRTIVFLDAGSIGDDIQWPDFGSFGQVVRYDQTGPGQVAERVRDATVILTNKVYISAEHMAAAPGLVYIGTLATGYNQVDIEAAAGRGVPVCNVPGYSTRSVVQHVFTLILALTSRICDLAASVRRGDWSKSLHFCYWDKPIMELDQKTIGIVGFGDIGSGTAAVAHALGMRVLAYAPRPRPEPGYEPFAFVSLEELFREADVVSLHCPLTPENTGMVNAALLRTMKAHALLINTARGPLINEPDLVEALRTGLIGGAGLDVVSAEPMPDDSPLRLAPNCIITPHVAWCSVEARQRLMRGVYDNLAAFLAGTPENVVNGAAFQG
jgi:glycerate dehydrogenase